MKARIPQFQEGLDFFCKNESWRGIYEAAPIGAKESLEIQFYCALRDKQGNPVQTEELLELSRNRKTHLKRADWKYLLMFAKDPRQVAFYKRCIAEATD